jgi:hypothetical protein
MSLPALHPRGPDRRRQPTPALSRYWLRGQRRGGRRAGEVANIHVDRCPAREGGWLLALMALALVDWAWTLVHLQRGVAEANPLLAHVLEHGGPVAFSVAKLGVTAAAAFVLLVHARHRLAQRLLPLAVALYALVMVVHLATAVVTA